MIDEVLDVHGRLDNLVNNVGITIDKMALNVSVAERALAETTTVAAGPEASTALAPIPLGCAAL